MTEAPRAGEAVLAKIVLVGPPGVGKASIIKSLAERFGSNSVRAGELGEGRVFRTKLIWPGLFKDGRSFEARLFAVSGAPAYNAVGELVLAAADGIVFVAPLRADQWAQTRIAMQTMVYNARQRGVDLAKIPVALHFHASGEGEMLDPAALLERLGFAPGSLPCFVTGPGQEERIQTPVEWVVAELARRAENAREAVHS